MATRKQAPEPTPLPLEFELPPEYVAIQEAPKNFIQAVKKLPGGTEFTCDTFAGQFPTRSPQGQGNLYNSPEFRALAEEVGMTRSARTSGRIGVYRRKTDKEVA